MVRAAVAVLLAFGAVAVVVVAGAGSWSCGYCACGGDIIII